MEEYTLVNRFTERYRTRGCQRVRSREVQILVVESFVLKKNRECEREEEEGAPMRGIDRRAPVPISHVGRQCHWRPAVTS
jgi:hypothetical protein